MKALSLFHRHQLNRAEKIPLVPEDQLWLLYRGEVINAEDKSLTPGKISTGLESANWQAVEPSIVYILHNSDWQTALLYCQELSNCFPATEVQKEQTDRQIAPKTAKKPLSHYPLLKLKGENSTARVIPFPGSESQSAPKNQKSTPYFPSPKVKVVHWWRRVAQQYPFYAQQSAADCGSACLVMIGSYWNKRFNINTLRDMTNVNRSGASLKALATAAETLRFLAVQSKRL